MSDAYTMTAPTVLNRASNRDSYLLVSYSHKNGRLVDEVLNRLFVDGANYWYDIEMSTGDNWKKKVSNFLQTRKGCGGMLFLASAQYLLSESCSWEMDEFLTRRKNDENFRAYVVLVLDPQAYENVKATGNPYEMLKLYAYYMHHQNGGLSTGELDKNLEKLGDILEKEKEDNVRDGKGDRFNNTYRSVILADDNVADVEKSLLCDIFEKNHFCVTPVFKKLSDYYQKQRELSSETDDNTGKTHYRIKFGKISNGKVINGVWTEFYSTTAYWTVYNLQNGCLSLLLKYEPDDKKQSAIGFCGRIMAKNKLKQLNGKNHLLRKSTDTINRFDFSDVEDRLVSIRFLYKEERESDELADEINWALRGDFDKEANRYFFVMGTNERNEKQFYYADRESTAVYENVWRDENASVIPVIDIRALND